MISCSFHMNIVEIFIVNMKAVNISPHFTKKFLNHVWVKRKFQQGFKCLCGISSSLVAYTRLRSCQRQFKRGIIIFLYKIRNILSHRNPRRGSTRFLSKHWSFKISTLKNYLEKSFLYLRE